MSANHSSQADGSGEPKRRSAPLLHFLPSITDVVFILLLFSMSCGVLAPRLLGDGGIGWHIRNGELILRTHTVTRTDPFSATMLGQPWYSWEWMYDAAVASAYQWAGLNGVVFTNAAVIALTFALLILLSLARGANILVALIFALLSFAASAIHLFARPHIFSWLLLIVWFQILDDAENRSERRRYVFVLPLIMLLWVNLHGEFLLGLVLLGLYLFSGICRFFTRPDERMKTLRWLKLLGAASAASFIFTLFNPFGYRLYLHIYRYLSDRWLMNHIDEFQSPNFHGWAQQSFVFLLVITIIVLALSRSRVSFSQLLVIVFAVHAGFYASRNLPTSCMLLTLIVAPHVVLTETAAMHEGEPFWKRLCNRIALPARRIHALESRDSWHVWPIVTVMLGIFVCSHGGRLGATQIMHAHFDPARFPVESASYISSQSITEPVFAPDAWGGYLIYRLGPSWKVFVDDRHDLYGDAFLQEYLKVVLVSPGWGKVLDERGLRWVLAPSGSSLAGILQDDSDWQLMYKDATASLFERK